MSVFLKLAKDAVEKYIKTGKTPSLPQNLPKKILSRQAGVFVSISIGNELRGCIGTYLPKEDNIAEEIIRNAVAAATHDYRFKPITEKELPKLSYSVYILEKPELVDDYKKLNPKKYGILVKTETGKSGLLLPGLEGIRTIEEQLEAVFRKSDILFPEKEKISIWRFTAKKY